MSEPSVHGTPHPTAGSALEDDHHRIDEYLTTFGRGLATGTVDEAAFTAASAGLRHHIYVEEELQFPALRQAGLLGPVMVMLREHGQIWDTLDAMETHLRNQAGSAGLLEMLQRLERLLVEHNAKEEQIIYPAGDQLLTADVAEHVLATLASGGTPPGWISEMSGRA